jgi:large subunit ribosomal protein L22
MPGVKTNEVPGTRAVLRHYRMSAYKARQVLDLVRGKDVDRAAEILQATPREGARVVAKVLASAVANARNNDFLDPDDLYVSACYADEGTTVKRWRPRARGRATRIRKRTCHITVIVSRLPEDRLERRRARQADQSTAVRSRRVAASRRSTGAADVEGSTSRATGAKKKDAESTDTELVEEGSDVGATGAGESGDVDTSADVTSASDDETSDEVESATVTEADDVEEAGTEPAETEPAGADAEEKD